MIYLPCGVSRRQSLKIGSLGLFGLNLPQLLRAADDNRQKGREDRKPPAFCYG
jgi:hypothetical protein